MLGFAVRENHGRSSPLTSLSTILLARTVWAIDLLRAQLSKTLALLFCFLAVSLTGIKTLCGGAIAVVVHVGQTWGKGSERTVLMRLITTTARQKAEVATKPLSLAAKAEKSPFLISDSLDKRSNLLAPRQKPLKDTHRPAGWAWRLQSHYKLLCQTFRSHGAGQLSPEP